MKKLILFLTGMLINTIVFAQITFEKTYGGTGFNQGFSVVQTSDGGYAVTGNDSTSDVYLIRTNQIGDTLWTNTFGGSYNDYGYSIALTDDNGFIITGLKYVVGLSYVYIIKTDENGDTLWTKIIGKNGVNSIGNSIIQLSDHGYIISGTTDNTGQGQPCSIYLIRTDVNGDTIWTKSLSGAYDGFGYHVVQANDSGYVVVGRRGAFVCLIKTDINGDTLWTKTYGDSYDEYGNSVANTNDGGYIIAGAIGIYGAGYNVYLIRTDSNGDTLWTKNFGGVDADFGYSVNQTSDGGFVISGETESFGAGSKDVYLIKTDSIGGALWTKTFGGANYDFSRCVDQTSDGGYIIVGSTESFDANWRKVYLIKTDETGIVLGNKDELPATDNEVNMFPNPVQNKITIETFEKATIEIINIQGQIIKTINTADKQTSIDVSDLSGGVYIVKAKTEKGVAVKKFIKE